MGNCDGYAENKIHFCVEELKREYVEFLYPLSRMKIEECDTHGITTDGTSIYYDPGFVTGSSVREVKYRIMHIIMHGILGHFEKKREMKSSTQKHSGWTVMDAQVWWILDRMGMKTKSIDISYADKVLGGNYDFRHCKKAEENERYAFELREAGRTISVDDHEAWEKNKDSAVGENVFKFWMEVRACLPWEGDGKTLDLFLRMQQNLKYHGKYVGVNMGSKEGAFQISRSPGRSYEDVLRGLLDRIEAAGENPDSIDYITYQYGMELYGNVALIEPGEECEKYTVNTLVIAVDVSGSCTSDKIMDLFWKETYGFLSQLKNSVSSGEIYLLQCDDEIQKEEYFTVDKITEEMPETVKVKGFGCTSFVPVFERADKLISEGKTISSLIYLTDGMGICVKEKRDYPVYFVLPGENGDVGESLPEWIECVYLDNN